MNNLNLACTKQLYMFKYDIEMAVKYHEVHN